MLAFACGCDEQCHNCYIDYKRLVNLFVQGCLLPFSSASLSSDLLSRNVKHKIYTTIILPVLLDVKLGLSHKGKSID
jgi:hypothetical protein